MIRSGETFIWLTPHTAVARQGGERRKFVPAEYFAPLCFSADVRNCRFWLARRAFIEICYIVLLIVGSKRRSVILNNRSSIQERSDQRPSLAYLNGEVPEKVLTFENPKEIDEKITAVCLAPIPDQNEIVN
jgi:hypothetical protein